MNLGFRRHTTTKKASLIKKPQNTLGLLWRIAFSVGQNYSLIGCSPAEPISAYPGNTKIKSCYKNV